MCPGRCGRFALAKPIHYLQGGEPSEVHLIVRHHGQAVRQRRGSDQNVRVANQGSPALQVGVQVRSQHDYRLRHRYHLASDAEPIEGIDLGVSALGFQSAEDFVSSDERECEARVLNQVFACVDKRERVLAQECGEDIRIQKGFFARAIRAFSR